MKWRRKRRTKPVAGFKTRLNIHYLKGDCVIMTDHKGGEQMMSEGGVGMGLNTGSECSLH